MPARVPSATVGAMPKFLARLLTSTAAVAVAALVCGPVPSAAAQSDPCPVVSTAVVSNALGTPVTGKATPGMPAGLDLCEFTDAAGSSFGVYREVSAFNAGAPVGAAGLVLRY